MAKITSPTSAALTGEAAAYQLALQALEIIAHHVREWDKKRGRDDLDFDDADVECDFALQLVWQEVERLRANPPPTLDEFGWAWYRMAAPVYLALKCYSKPDDTFGALLKRMVRHFYALPEAWEVLGNEQLRAPMSKEAR